jgi:hypothetical protein
MTRKDALTRYSRIGLILAAFALVVAIVLQPLWQRLRPTAITVTEGGRSRIP